MSSRSHQNIIPAEDRDFFLLLRAGLWQRVEEPLSEAPDWAYIYRLACEQTVQGIVADGIGLYKAAHPECQVDAPVYEDFLDQCAQIIRQNYKVNQVQAKVCQLLDEGLNQLPSRETGEGPGDRRGSYVILKGQGVAQCYPKPMLRCSGDIDLLLPPESYERAKKLLDPEGKHLGSENRVDLHYGVEIDGIEVELHGMANTESGGCLDRVLDRERDLLFQTRHFDFITIADTPCPLPNVNYHAMYLFFHCLRHYMGTGLGIRQICDMAMFIHTYRQQLDDIYINNIVSEARVQKEWNQFMNFCVEFLGMPSIEQIPIKGDVRGSSIWEHCSLYGNFGHNINDGCPSTNWFARKFWVVQNLLKQFRKVAKYNPRIAFNRLMRYRRFLKQ